MPRRRARAAPLVPPLSVLLPRARPALMVGAACAAAAPAPAAPAPFVLDNDGNYDDMLAFVYLAKHPLVDLKALTLSQGFATQSGGVPNMQKVAELLGVPTLPVAYGVPASRSPMANFPLQWRVELDDWVDSTATLPDFNRYPPSHLSAPELLVELVRSSPRPVHIVVTGSMTNVAAALERDRGIVDNIAALYFSGTAYSNRSDNNVYDWQMTFNGDMGGCTEQGWLYNTLQRSLNVTKLGFPVPGDMAPLRPRCRGVNMTAAGDTEWNVFLDVRAYHEVVMSLGVKGVPMYMMATGGTADLHIRRDDADLWAAIAAVESPTLRAFLQELFTNFLSAGEAKWWDAAAAMMASDVLAGRLPSGGVCADWRAARRHAVRLHWTRGGTYGQTYDTEHGAPADFCVWGDEHRTFAEYWGIVQPAAPLPAPPAHPRAPPVAAAGVAAALERVAALRERGLLTADEYAAAKRRIL